MWLISAFLKRHIWLLLVSIIGLTLLIVPFIKITANLRPVYNEGIVGNYTLVQIPPRVLSLISDGLVSFDKSGTIIPNLAESWEAKNEGKSFVFHLRPNLKWQDNKPLRSTEIAVSFPGVEVNYLNESTIVFDLPEPFSPFPGLLAKPVFRKDTLVGTGLYKIKKINRKNGVVTEIKLQSISRDLPNINFKFYPTDKLAVTALMLGQVQAVSNLQNLYDLGSWPNLTTRKIVNLQKYVAVFLNTSKLQDKELRTAINQAIDREKLGGGQQALGPISPNSWAYNPNLKPVIYDAEKSKKIISEKLKGKENLKMITFPEYEELAVRLIKMWENVGLKVELEVVSNVNPENLDYDLLLSSQDIPYDPDQYMLWHSTQKRTNKSKVSNPRIDKSLEDGRKILDIEIRKQKYIDFQRFIVEDSIAAFLYYPAQYFIYYNDAGKLIDKLNTRFNGFNLTDTN